MKKYTPKIDKTATSRIKTVKRSYKGSTKAPKASSKKVGTKKTGAKKTSSYIAPTPKTTIKKPNNAKKTPKRTRAEILAEAAKMRQARFEAKAEREAQKQIREYEKWLDTEKSTNAILKEMDRADREYKKAERGYKKQLRAEKERAITENKMRAAGRDPENYSDSLKAMISDKLYQYAATSPEHRKQLAEILGLTEQHIEQYDWTDEESFKNNIYGNLVYQGYDENKLTSIYRGIESFGRTERLHVRGIEQDMDEETAKNIYSDILSSDKVSPQTKAILKKLGLKGVLVYINYRQIQRLKFGKNYKEMFYNEAAQTFWDDSSDKATMKKFGYKFSNKTANMINDSSVALSRNTDASNFTKFAATTMKPEEATDFINELKNIKGFNIPLKVQYVNGKRKVVNA